MFSQFNKKRKAGDDGKKLDWLLSDVEYLSCRKKLERIWHEKYG